MGNGIRTLVAVALMSAAPAQALDAERIGGDPRAAIDAVNALFPGGGDWIVEEVDNVCGLKDARQLRNPAAVNYESIIAVTVEWREMKRKGIDRDSPEGQVLYNKAVDRVRIAASDHMKTQGYDSIWKEIKHRRGLKAPDATADVKRLVENATVETLADS